MLERKGAPLFDDCAMFWEGEVRPCRRVRDVNAHACGCLWLAPR